MEVCRERQTLRRRIWKGLQVKIRRFYFTKESEWMRNVRREDKDGPWCRYEDVEPLLKRIKELEKQLEFERSLEDKI